jgi:hypothetical protein
MEPLKIRKPGTAKDPKPGFELISFASEKGKSYTALEELYSDILKDTYEYNPALYEHPVSMMDY